ncbi:hypothetical protein [Bradyrhizobium sp. SYSU BS000235]|uniref:hypothetical protein n=1 Tax=Bradyrhizobium sp. SYSU BS000235 TaxID=3411332 RepID=UPI003C76231E
MRIVFFAILGAIGGLAAGGALGLLTGIAWLNIFNPSEFEGYAATMVFFAFTPIGAIAGGLVGAIWAGAAASRARLHVERNRRQR